jgi:hypothetical protein
MKEPTPEEVQQHLRQLDRHAKRRLYKEMKKKLPEMTFSEFNKNLMGGKNE